LKKQAKAVAAGGRARCHRWLEWRSHGLPSLIWLNRLMDDHHFSYLTKLKKKKCGTQREPAPTSSPSRMDGVWTKDTFSLYSCPIANHND